MDIIKRKELIGVLLSFLLISCENSATSSEVDDSEQLLLSFDMRLDQDDNGYYHLDMNENSWQTLHRVSANVVSTDSMPVEFFWIEWESNLYWYLGDTLGYIITRNFNDSGMYVSVDTSYMIGFDGMEVPTSNMISYSNSYGEINNMIAPVRSMIGDTLTLTAIWYNSEKDFKIVLD
tara:strand:- start:54 stop:584 length:531 start_codon:yes stop_codon:yes gene_type:complete